MPTARRAYVVSDLPAFRLGGVWFIGSALHPSLSGRIGEL